MSAFTNLEQTLFRRVNAVLEPALRKGIGSFSFTRASLIVLETTGFKSGLQRRTPLWSLRLGRYRMVSTARGDRSFWIKNMQLEPQVSYYVGGKQRRSTALVLSQGQPLPESANLTPFLRKLTDVVSQYAGQGWAFAILTPANQTGA